MNRYEKEYNQLIKDFGYNKVHSLFSSGLEGYMHSRTFGNYSVDSIRQTLKNIQL